MALRPDLLDDLRVVIDAYELLGHEREGAYGVRRTTEVRLHGAGETGVGEDVVYDPELQAELQEHGTALPLAGTWTVGELSERLADLELFPRTAPDQPAYPLYRRWAFESAAADLALRQAGTSLAAVLGREPRPLTFVVSPLLGRPPSFGPVARRLAAYPGMRFKLDYAPEWDDALIDALAGTGAVATIDFKGAYKGTVVDVVTDARLYARCAEAFPDAWLEDPDLEPADARAALEPYSDRITWDAPIHGVADLERLPYKPRAVNVKPSRIGSWRELLAVYAWCEREGVAPYGGGQSELGPGRGQIQALASLLHPDAPNDVAPPGLDWTDFDAEGLPVSPLAVELEATGFRRRS